MAKPTLIALFLYALLPVFENTLTGLTTLPPTVMDAAKGAGMTGWQRLVKVELPLALPAILAGIRLSAVISLSTATIGSTVAARTLGEVIIAGLQSNNLAFILQGGLIVAVLAILIHASFSALEKQRPAKPGTDKCKLLILCSRHPPRMLGADRRNRNIRGSGDKGNRRDGSERLWQVHGRRGTGGKTGHCLY